MALLNLFWASAGITTGAGATAAAGTAKLPPFLPPTDAPEDDEADALALLAAEEDEELVAADDELDEALLAIELDEEERLTGTSSSTGVELHADISSALSSNNPIERLL